MAFMEDVVIVSAVRTPIGKFQGSLSDFSAPQLGAIVVREASGAPASISTAAMNASWVTSSPPDWGRTRRARLLSAADSPTASAP